MVVDVVYGDFEWEDTRAAANLVKHGVSFEEAATVFSDPCYILLAEEAKEGSFWAIGLSGLARLLTVVHVERGPRFRIVSARKATQAEQECMSDDASEAEPSADSLDEIPEVDFSRGIQPHRYARLKPGYRYTVHLEPDLWEHFGSADEVRAALRALIDASRHVRAAGE